MSKRRTGQSGHHHTGRGAEQACTTQVRDRASMHHHTGREAERACTTQVREQNKHASSHRWGDRAGMHHHIGDDP